MDKLKKSRAAYQARTDALIEKIEEELAFNNEEFNRKTFEKYYHQLEDKQKKLAEVNEKILALIPDEEDEKITSEMDSSEAYDETIQEAKRNILHILGIANTVSSLQGQTKTESHAGQATVKLPHLTIQKFDGEPTQWLEFWGSFSTSIDQNRSLAKTDKFNYLKFYLEGPALRSIKAYSLSNENYDHAVQTLKYRFGKKNHNMRAHMNKLIQLVQVKSSSDVQALRQLYDTCDTQIKSLETLGVQSTTYCSMLYTILMNCFPSELNLEYNKKIDDEDEWDLDYLLEYIRREVESRERALIMNKPSVSEKKAEPSYQRSRNEASSMRPFNNFSRSRIPTTVALNTTVTSACIFCEKPGHKPDNCNVTYEEKIETIKAKNRCFNCLGSEHTARRCKSRGRCQYCNRNHHTSICREKLQTPEKPASEIAVGLISLKDFGLRNSQVYLQTLSLIVEGATSETLARCIFDNGSQRSFIREDVSRALKLPVVFEELVKVTPFGETRETTKIQRRVKVKLRSTIEPDVVIELTLIESPIICGAVVGVPGDDIRQQMISKGLQLAEVTELNGAKVSPELIVLIGADYYWKLSKQKFEKLDGEVVAVETVFGWSVQGPTPVSANLNVQSSVAMTLAVEEDLLSQCLRRFWELEALGIEENPQITKTEQDIIDHHRSTITMVDGRYQVQLPWKAEYSRIDDNLAIATRRMNNLIKRFQRNPALFLRYKEVIDDYLDQDIIEALTNDSITTTSGSTYYNPHFEIERGDKTTTKTRIVFDASSKEKGSKSLNDCLSPGPNLNPNLLEILLRFRMHRIGIMADVEKAFLQISLDPKDRDYVRFLWIEDFPGQEKPTFIHMRMKRVLFGVTSSPFLLSATLQFHFDKLQDEYPEICDILRKNIYVDDYVGGTFSVEEALEVRRQSCEVMNQARMNLRKWVSSSKEVMAVWSREDGSDHITAKQLSSPLKVLGITWHPASDTFSFDISSLLEFLTQKKDTKRSLLQAAARLFDPIGLLAPFVIVVKCLFQELWKQGVDWDDYLPLEINKAWQQWCFDLPNLQKLSIPRWYFADSESKVTGSELHLFCDASEKAYASVIYLRYRTEQGCYGTSIISSKTRVTPLKKVTLPRLELMAAVIGSRLLKHTLAVFEGKVTRYHCWSDSQITLHWIRGQTKEWKPFVANRIKEIQAATDPMYWSYCCSQDNPADMPSRGCTINELIDNPKWWHGPTWLYGAEEKWPASNFPISSPTIETVIDERRVAVLSCVVEQREPLLDLHKYQSASRVFRTTAWILRFRRNIKVSPDERIYGPLSSEEIKQARDRWMRDVQTATFTIEINCLEKNQPIPSSSRIAQFLPFMDNNLLRVGGRLQNSGLQFAEKHPLILPSKHRLTELLVREAHEKVMHGGFNSTMTELRETYWILQGRQLVKNVVQKCYICRRYAIKGGNQVFAPLPRDRVTEAAPFTITGVDFAGPLYVRNPGTNLHSKVYIALYTCAVTRALHFEIVTDMSSEKFLLSFGRFTARRGLCHTLYSDNAKAFKRTEKDLADMFLAIQNNATQEFLSRKGIKWKSIVPKAAWWGGFWERLVRSVKTCLKKTLGRTSLTLEELITVMTEIEAVLNSRPLTHTFTDGREPLPLTPPYWSTPDFLARSRV